MKTPCRLASSLFLVIALSCAVEAPPPDSGGDTAGMFAFVDVNVIPMDRRISGVMLQGRWLGREEIEQGLEQLAVSYQAGTN